MCVVFERVGVLNSGESALTRGSIDLISQVPRFKLRRASYSISASKCEPFDLNFENEFLDIFVASRAVLLFSTTKGVLQLL